MMNGYVLSVLGIVIVGVMVDVIIPAGSLSKYIKSMYSIFVVAVLVTPIVNILSQNKDFKLEYEDVQLQENVINYILNERVKSNENSIETTLSKEGFSNVDIILNYSIENNDIVYKSCMVNLKNMAINSDKQHINKYEFIKEVVANETKLSLQEIIINEWGKEKDKL